MINVSDLGGALVFVVPKTGPVFEALAKALGLAPAPAPSPAQVEQQELTLEAPVAGRVPKPEPVQGRRRRGAGEGRSNWPAGRYPLSPDVVDMVERKLSALTELGRALNGEELTGETGLRGRDNRDALEQLRNAGRAHVCHVKGSGKQHRAGPAISCKAPGHDPAARQA